MNPIDRSVVQASLEALGSSRRVSFLVDLSGELTMAGRDSYVGAGHAIGDSQRSLHCLNELQIVVGTQLATAVLGEDPAYPDDAFLTVLGERSQSCGQLDHLQCALARAATHSAITE
jgi:hypothetical protein